MTRRNVKGKSAVFSSYRNAVYPSFPSLAIATLFGEGAALFKTSVTHIAFLVGPMNESAALSQTRQHFRCRVAITILTD